MICQALKLIMKNADTQNEMIRLFEKQERLAQLSSLLNIDVFSFLIHFSKGFSSTPSCIT
jgi:hypothetical protein